MKPFTTAGTIGGITTKQALEARPSARHNDCCEPRSSAADSSKRVSGAENKGSRAEESRAQEGKSWRRVQLS